MMAFTVTQPEKESERAGGYSDFEKFCGMARELVVPP
jgi:hypothetical protein